MLGCEDQNMWFWENDRRRHTVHGSFSHLKHKEPLKIQLPYSKKVLNKAKLDPEPFSLMDAMLTNQHSTKYSTP